MLTKCQRLVSGFSAACVSAHDGLRLLEASGNVRANVRSERIKQRIEAIEQNLGSVAAEQVRGRLSEIAAEEERESNHLLILGFPKSDACWAAALAAIETARRGIAVASDTSF